MDLKLIEKLSRLFSIPIIFVGGVGKLEHVKSAFKVGANAVGGGSFFVLHGDRFSTRLSKGARF